MSGLHVPQTETQSAFPSPTHTVVDLDSTVLNTAADKPTPAPSNKSITPSNTGADADIETSASAEPKLSQRKKWSLLMVFCLGFFIDVWMYSAFFVFTGPISADLGVPFEQQTWVITSYAVTFAAFLLFWGRVSDLYSAKPVFSYGFVVLGILSLVISFLPDRYSFFVIRAISGIAGATLIPASFRLIVAVFEPHEIGKAFVIYGFFGAIANSEFPPPRPSFRFHCGGSG